LGASGLTFAFRRRISLAASASVSPAVGLARAALKGGQLFALIVLDALRN
jgi:hypothetical protein